MDEWDNEGGATEDDDFEWDTDRVPRIPKDPNFFGGAELEIPEPVEEEELSCV